VAGDAAKHPLSSREVHDRRGDRDRLRRHVPVTRRAFGVAGHDVAPVAEKDVAGDAGDLLPGKRRPRLEEFRQFGLLG
jgi:hypothetical protein